MVASRGWELIDEAWFDVVDELMEIAKFDSNAANRIEASRVILEYITNLGTSINPPHVPEQRVPDKEEDEENNDD